MRRAGMIGSIVAVLTLGPALLAEPVPYDTAVRVPEVEVRSGPSSKFYPTLKLRLGDRVKVLEEKEGGWLAIKPPDGSFSWIQAKLIDRAGASATVLAPEAPILVGSSLTNDKPSVKGTTLQRGAQVVILSDKQVYAEDGAWFQIQAPPQELRFIPADAVKVPTPVQAQAAGTTTTANPADMTAVADPLWNQAQQLEQAGKRAEAERVYEELARKTTDHELSMRCYNRIHYLRDGYRCSVAPTYPASRSNDACFGGPAAGGGRLVPAPAYPASQGAYPQPPVGRTTSQYSYIPETSRAPIGQGQPVGYGQAPPQAAANWSGPGWLRRAPFSVDSRPTYALESNQGLPRLYITAQPGMNLEPYLNRNVNLYGTILYRGDLKTNYMMATQVNMVP